MIHLEQEITTFQPHWAQIYQHFYREGRCQKIETFLGSEGNDSPAVIFPKSEHRFRIFRELDAPAVKVVILGQDPYHGTGEAMGRAFAVPESHHPKPPSLKNILKEALPKWSEANSELSGWVEQGVFLLNTLLTVREGRPLSHQGVGWEEWTDRAIIELARISGPRVFLLWGREAQKKRGLITEGSKDTSSILVLEAPHPSPLSAHRGFFGCGHFQKASQFLADRGVAPIDWALT